MPRLQTVVELPEFLRRANATMSDDERMGIVTFLAANPEAGIALGGGLRKVTVFSKNERDNLSKPEQAAAVQLSKALLATYGDIG